MLSVLIPAWRYLIFTLHIQCKHIKPIPDGIRNRNLQFHKQADARALGLREVFGHVAPASDPTSLIRSRQTDTPRNKRVELQINQRACVAEMPFIKSKWVKKKKGQQNTFINAGACSMGKMIYLGEKRH